MSNHIPGIRARHPALTDRKELERLMTRYDDRPSLVATAIGVSSNTVMQAMHRLAPDLVARLKSEGKLNRSYGTML